VRQLTLGVWQLTAKSRFKVDNPKMMSISQNEDHISIRPNRSGTMNLELLWPCASRFQASQASQASQLQRCCPLPEDSSRDLHAERHTVHSAAAGSITGTCSRSTSSFRHPSISTTAGELRPPPGQHTSRAARWMVLYWGAQQPPTHPYRSQQGAFVWGGRCATALAHRGQYLWVRQPPTDLSCGITDKQIYTHAHIQGA
jgi:hypothetical protein